MPTKSLARPFRNSGMRYIPKKKKPELNIQLRVCRYLRQNYPDVIFHSDYAANADLSKNQQKINSALQSRHKFPDIIIPAASRGYVGLVLELKNDGTTVILKIGPNKGKLTTDEHIRGQAVTLRKMAADGWYANFTIGYQQTINVIDWYFQREQQELF